MFDDETTVSNNSTLNQIRIRRKAFAFALTSCACFALMTLLWPLSVTGFKSQSTVSWYIGNSELARRTFEDNLVESVTQEIESPQLKEMLSRVRQKCTLENRELAAGNVDGILNSLSVQIRPEDTDDGGLGIDFAFVGQGSRDERVFVDVIADEITNRSWFQASLAAADSGSDTGTIHAIAGTSQVDELEQLNWLVTQLENDLVTIRDRVGRLGAGSSEGTPFRSASHTNGHLDPLDSIQQALNSIDTSAMKDCLARASRRDSVASSAHEGRGKLVTWRSSTQPIGGVPQFSHLLLVGLMSVAIGGVVAWNYSAFHNHGFQSVSQIAVLLRIPVIATLPTKTKASNAASSIGSIEGQPMANQIVGLAGMVLLGLVLTTLGFCVINEEVRVAFLSNPFHGLSRIVWMFVGY